MNILVVDDENLIRYSLSKTLADRNILVLTAASGTEALAEIRKYAFDVCILDLHLPDMSGLDIIRILRAMSPTTKIIVISGEFLTQENRKMVQDNAILFLEKPFDLELLKSFIHLLYNPLNTTVNSVLRDREDRGEAERRRHFRTADERLLLCSTFPSSGARSTYDLELRARLRDISSSGAGICTQQALVPGCRIRLFDGIMAQEGTVQWSTTTCQQGMYNIGIQFTPAA